MNIPLRTKLIIPIIGLIAATMACGLPFASPRGITPTVTATVPLATLITLPSSTSTVTPTPGLSGGGSTGGVGGSSGGAGGGSGGSGGGSGSGGSGGSGGGDGSAEATATQPPDVQPVIYHVKQIETLGGESISGIVCSLTKPFSVLSVTPHVTFSFNFVPLNEQRGNVTYVYSIPSAGESHDASGTYSLTSVDNQGTLQLTLSVSDHVVFKGFDGNIPNRYKFNLVPTAGAPCP
jgi:hypothetical protein